MRNQDLTIKQWSDISSLCDKSTLILGNGASISLSKNFSYSSLKKCAIDIGLFNESIKKLFDFFRTDDFEFILRVVWQSYNVNKALNIEDNKTKDAYEHIRDCLIKSVRSIHPTYQEVSEHLPKISNFMRIFKYIFNLNYDLIVYWALMHGNGLANSTIFKDYFIDGEFSNKWMDSKHNQGATLVFYPHGNLVLARDIYEDEHKILSGYDYDNLLENILSAWESDRVIPLFVSEGTFEQKIKAIKSSNYLSRVYDQVLYRSVPYYWDDRKINIVIYGWSIGEQDNHILSQLKLSAYRFYPQYIKIAISVYNKDMDYRRRVIGLLNREFGERIEIYFFDSASEGCWNN